MEGIVIKLGSKTKTVNVDESYTFKCEGLPLSASSDLTIEFNCIGYFTYDGLTTVAQPGKSRVLKCAGKIMASDITITAKEYAKSPIEISTRAEMDNILDNATPESVGSVYKYTGGTGAYESDTLYIIEEVN